MRICEPRTTARDAADRFAATAFGEPRTVGEVKHLRGQLRFRLVNGTHWYRVSMIPDFSGWEIKQEKPLNPRRPR